MSPELLETVGQAEADRRLRMLDGCYQDHDAALLRMRAQQMLLSSRVLTQWRTAYERSGFAGLVPQEWALLPAHHWHLAQARAKALAAILEVPWLDSSAFTNHASMTQWPNWRDMHAGATVLIPWSPAQVERWLRRYRVGGIYALAPTQDPLRQPRRSPARHEVRAEGLLDETDWSLITQRLQALGSLITLERLSHEAVLERVTATGITAATLRSWHARFRAHGRIGLARQIRSDSGNHHGISPLMVQIIEGVRLSQRDLPVRAVYEQARQRAATLNETPPGLWQVRSICAGLPVALTALADGRQDAFLNRSHLTYPIPHRGTFVVFQMDPKAPIHLLVKDQRKYPYRTKTGEVRPYLTLVMDANTRLVVASVFTYDHPDRFTIGEAIRRALVAYGAPAEIWVDHGKELVSTYVSQLVQGLGIHLFPGRPHYPKTRGIVERFHQTTDTRLWATLPGYVGQNTVERNPHARAVYALAEVIQKFEAFITEYHQEIHSVTGQRPLEDWGSHCFTTPVDLRRLDMLLLEPETGIVQKDGIHYQTHRYWNAALGVIVNQRVLFRAPVNYTAPLFVEVYVGQQWYCTAAATDSHQGQAITQEVVVQAQRTQTATFRRRLRRSRGVETDTRPLPVITPPLPSPARLPPPVKRPPPVPRTSPTAPSDFFDFLIQKGPRR